MTAEKLENVRRETRRFLEKLDERVRAAKTDQWALYGNAKMGSLRRESMDLTWALAEMRKP